MTEERLEKLYWELDDLERDVMVADWSADNFKMLNNTKIHVFDTLYKEYHANENPEKVMRSLISRHIEKLKSE